MSEDKIDAIITEELHIAAEVSAETQKVIKEIMSIVQSITDYQPLTIQGYALQNTLTHSSAHLLKILGQNIILNLQIIKFIKPDYQEAQIVGDNINLNNGMSIKGNNLFLTIPEGPYGIEWVDIAAMLQHEITHLYQQIHNDTLTLTKKWPTYKMGMYYKTS